MTHPVSLVTGAGGFLGSHTVERLLGAGHRVRAVDLPGTRARPHLAPMLADPKLSFVESDILGIPPADPLFQGVDYAFHCGGNPDHVASLKNPEPFFQANVATLIRVLEGARLNGIRKVINPSSAAIYGTAVPPTAEDHPIRLASPYALTKWMGEEACQHWWTVFGVPTLSFRVFNGYGPRLEAGPANYFIKRKRAGQPITITGDGSAVRDFIYITDIVDAFIAGCESDRAGEAYNLASGKPQTVLELARLVGGEIVHVDPRPEPPVILADIAKIRAHLGWEPKISLAEGVALMLELHP